MGVRLFGYNTSGNRTKTLDVGTMRIVPTGASSNEINSPGGLACCLFVYSSNTWVPLHWNWLS